MFNAAIDDLAMKPYIPHKSLLQWICCKVLRDTIGIAIFDLRGHGGCWRSKTPLGDQKWHEGIDLLKKVLNKSFSTTSNTLKRVQSDLSYDLRVESYDFWGHRDHSSIHCICTKRLGTQEAGVPKAASK